MSIKLPTIPAVGLSNPYKYIFDKLKLINDTREGLNSAAEDRSITGQDLIDLGLTTKADLEKMYRNR